MQSTSAIYLTKVSPGHFAVWFRQWTASPTATGLWCVQLSQAFSYLPTTKQRWIQQRAAAAQPSDSMLEQEMQGKKRRKSHWSQMVLVKRRINRDKYQPIQYSPQPFHCKHQSMEERVLGGAAADCTPSLLQPLGYPKLVQTSIHPHHTFKQVWFNLKPTSRKGQTHYWHTGSLQGSDQNLTRKYKHPPVAHGALVIWGTPVRPFSPRQ